MTVYTFPRSLQDKSINPAYITFQYYKNDFGVRVPSHSLTLSMPEDISQPSTISWDNEKFGMAGEGMKNALQKMANKDEVSPQTIESISSSVSSRVANIGGFSLAANGAGALGSNASAEGMMGAVSGKIANPYVTAIFRGVNFRNFDFVFRFTPLSEKDCDYIHEIIQVMREMSLPDSQEGMSYLGYPYECNIFYGWQGKRNPWLNRFKRAACTKIDINYTGTGSFSAMRNGFPTQIIVTTSWTELDLVVRQDIKDGY